MNDHQYSTVFNLFERNFADLMARLSPDAPTSLRIAAATAARAVSLQHTCCRLDQLHLYFDGAVPDFIPPLSQWKAELLRCHTVLSSTAETPLVLQDDRLYLQRYYLYEKQLAEAIKHFSARRTDFNAAEAGMMIRELPPCTENCGFNDMQRQLALFSSLRSRLVVISSRMPVPRMDTAAEIVRLNVRSPHRARRSPPRVMLVASTWKGLAGLTQSVACAWHEPPIMTDTMHRLMGGTPEHPEGKYHQNNRIPCEIAVVEEASAMSLTLLAKFFSAIPNDSLVILLGDRYQLGSHESSCAFGELCCIGRPESFTEGFISDFRCAFDCDPIGLTDTANNVADVTIELNNRRQTEVGDGIYRLAEAVRTVSTPEDVHAIYSIIHQFPSELSALAHGEKCENSNEKASAEAAELCRTALDHYLPLLCSNSPETALSRLDEFRVLTATKEGSLGSDAVNRLICNLLAARRMWPPWTHTPCGYPLLIVDSDREFELFAGDTGVAFFSDDKIPVACFHARNGQDVRSIPLSLLPKYELAFATPIHMLRSSAFDEALLLLPDNPDFLHKQLFYTAVTCVRNHIYLRLPSEERLSPGLLHDAFCGSGLKEHLVQPDVTRANPAR